MNITWLFVNTHSCNVHDVYLMCRQANTCNHASNIHKMFNLFPNIIWRYYNVHIWTLPVITLSLNYVLALFTLKIQQKYSFWGEGQAELMNHFVNLLEIYQNIIPNSPAFSYFDIFLIFGIMFQFILKRYWIIWNFDLPKKYTMWSSIFFYIYQNTERNCQFSSVE